MEVHKQENYVTGLQANELPGLRQPISGPNGPESGPKLGFSPFSQIGFISFPLTCIGW